MGMKNEVIAMRSQRNSYDHAVRAAGVTLVEVGFCDRFIDAGVRDTESWEIKESWALGPPKGMNRGSPAALSIPGNGC